ncbi:MAG: glycosyltransferase [Paracoccaceae bacterium]
MELPKVLHIHFGKEGGAERFFVSLVNAFSERGLEQQFIIRPNRIWQPEIAGLGPIIHSNYRRFSLASLLLNWRVRSLIKSWHPDAIMAWMPRAARLMPNAKGPVKLTRLGDFPKHLKHFQTCDVLVCNLPGIGERCESLGWQKPIRIISNFPPQVTPNPVPRSTLNTPDNAFVISGASRFVQHKGIDLLIRAAARIPGAYLWLIGDGKERPALEALVDEYGLRELTRFVGWVDEPIDYIAASDVFGMPSRHEPLGNVILEAWQAGIPVVATRTEGPTWYMKNGKNGYLIDIDDLDCFTQGLEKVKNDTAFAQRIIKGGTHQLNAMFTKKGVVDQYIDLFTDPAFK